VELRAEETASSFVSLLLKPGSRKRHGLLQLRLHYFLRRQRGEVFGNMDAGFVELR